MTLFINEAHTTIGAINDVIQQRLAPALEGTEESVAIASMLTLILLLMKPEIEADEIATKVQDISAYLVTLIDDATTERIN